MREETSLLKSGERLDDLERDGLRLLQHPGRFCYGVDAVLLSWFARAKEGDQVLDLCTGSGVVPILMSAKTKGEHFTGLEIQEEVADMAERSVRLNGLSGRIDIVCGDLKDAPELLGRSRFDVVTVNPPYMSGGGGLMGRDASRNIARHEILCTLEDVLFSAAGLLKPGGRFFMVHRPARLGDIFAGMRQARMSVDRLCLVHPKASRPATLALIEGVRGGSTQVKADPPVILFEEDGSETRQIRVIHGKE